MNVLHLIGIINFFSQVGIKLLRYGYIYVAACSITAKKSGTADSISIKQSDKVMAFGC